MAAKKRRTQQERAEAPTMFNDPSTLREYTDRWRADGVWFEVVQVREAKGTALALAEVPRG